MTAEREAARQEFSRVSACVLELYPDQCQREYGKSYTNLLWPSEDFTNSNWNKSVIVIANQEIAPDGTLTASSLEDDNSSANESLNQPVTLVNNNESYTASVYLKKGTAEKTQVKFQITGGTGVSSYPVIDWTSLTVSSASEGHIFEYVVNGWYRLSFVVTNNGTGNTSGLFIIWPAKYDGGGATTGTVYAWGAQLVKGNKPGHYVKSTTASATAGCGAMDAKANLVLYSHQVDTNLGSYHLGSNATRLTANVSDPFGTNNAYRYRSDAVGGCYISQSIALQAGITYTASIWARKNSGTITTGKILNINNGAGVSGTNYISATNLITDWVRYDLTFTTTIATTFSIFVWSGTDALTQIDLIGFQLVPGSQPGIYYKTEATAFSGTVGAECYKTFPSCQAKADFSRGSKVEKYITRGTPLPVGETMRPYITEVKGAPTEADPAKGLGRRAYYEIKLTDEIDSDVGNDPYSHNRASPPGGTHWGRWLARNPNYQTRKAVLRRGYIINGVWDWNTFQDEQFSIEQIDGPDDNGVVIKLKDPIKRADYVKIPPPSDGKLQAALNDYEDAGTAQGGSLNTIVLRSDASAVDDYYNGMTVRITGQTGAGQERKIIDYVGSSRTATVETNWSVSPEVTSIYFVQVIQITLQAGAGAQYAKYGVPGYIRIGKEAIKFTAINGDVLSWPDSTHRAQFDTAIEAHKENAKVQIGKYFDNDTYTDVVKWLINQCGLDDTYIDLAGFAQVEDTWLGSHYRISIALFAPEKASELLRDLLQHGPCMSWWNPVAQIQRLIFYGPPPPDEPTITLTDEAEFKGKPEIERLDDERITAAAMAFDLISPTADRKEDSNYQDGYTYYDTDASGPNEYNGDRFKTMHSRWYGQQNARAAQSWTLLQLAHLRDSPSKIKAKVDPKDFDFDVGDYRNIKTEGLPDFDGNPKTVKVLITKIQDQGKHVQFEARTTIFNQRFGFFAFNDAQDYPNNDGYGCFSQGDTEFMPDGTSAYLFY